MSRADSHPSHDARPFFSWRPCGSPSSRCFCSLPAAWRSRFHWNRCCLEAERLVFDWRKTARVIYFSPLSKKGQWLCPVPMCTRKSGMAREWPLKTWTAATGKNWVQAAGGHLWPGDQGETEKWASCFKVANQPKGWQPVLKTEHNLW